MSATPPPLIDPAPTPAPQRGDRATFRDRVDAFITWLTAAVALFQAVADNVYANAIQVYSWALSAAVSAADAASSAAAASSSSNAVKWVAGTYADGDAVWDPLNRLPYRSIGAGVRNTNPSLDSAHWAIQLLAVGLGGMNITGNIALISNSISAITANPTSPGLYATLPDATTCQKAVALFAIQNNGDYDYGVKDYTGAVLGWVRAGAAVTIGLSDNSTAAGTWLLPDIQKIGVTAILASPSISTATNDTNILRVVVDANRTFVLFGLLYGALYDSSTQSWLGPVLIRSISTGGRVSAVLSGANQILVTTCSGGAAEAVTVTIGAGLTVNTANKATWTLSGSVTSWSNLTVVGASWVQGYGDSGVGMLVRALTVTGVTPAVGGSATLTSASSNGALVLFAAGSIVRAVGTDGSALYAQPYTVSGTGLTPGTRATTGSTSTSNDARAWMNGNGNIVVQHVNSAAAYITIFKLSGTVEAASTANVTSINAGSVSDYLPINASKVLLGYADTTNTYLYLTILTDTAGVPSLGAPYNCIGGNGGPSAVAALALTGTTGRFVFKNSAGSGFVQVSVDCSGSAPSLLAIQSVSRALNVPLGSGVSDGARSFTKLTVGTAVYGMSGTQANDSRFAPNSVQAQVPMTTNFLVGAPGAANEAWCLDNSAVAGGRTIKRVEAAA
jgi:hypothetical protein